MLYHLLSYHHGINEKHKVSYPFPSNYFKHSISIVFVVQIVKPARFEKVGSASLMFSTLDAAQACLDECNDTVCTLLTC